VKSEVQVAGALTFDSSRSGQRGNFVVSFANFSLATADENENSITKRQTKRTKR
jgi:hypothetical protein